MKKLSKVMALVLSLILIVSAFTACGGGKKSKDPSKYTYWVAIDSRSTATLNSYNDMLYYQELNRATGVDVEFIHPTAGSTGQEAFQVMLASGDYPDMVEYCWDDYPGGPDAAIKDNIIISLNDYIEEYAPNYYDFMEGERGKEAGYAYKAQSLSAGGNYYTFNAFVTTDVQGYAGFYVRKDLLDKWGLDIPVTIDDWDELFRVAKANGIQTPFTCKPDVFDFTMPMHKFNSAWRVGSNFYIDNGEVKFGPYEPAFKEYLAKMSEWTKKGYIDKDYVTNQSIDVEGKITNGISIATVGYVIGGIGKLLDAMKDRDPEFNLVACPFPVLKEGEVPFAQEYTGETIKWYATAITSQCSAEDPDRFKNAMKWLDYAYSDEGLALKFFGVEGDTCTKETASDGTVHYKYTDKIYDYESVGAHSIEQAIYKFVRGAQGPGGQDHPDYITATFTYPQQEEAIKIWNENLDEALKHVVPPLNFTAEESADYAEITAVADQNLNAAISNIILGKADVSTLDAAIAQAKKDGYDRLLEIHQAAYGRYMDIINEK